MKPLAPEELSALLDGELDPIRAREVERLVESDPQLRAEFERLGALDRTWAAAARTAAFHPTVSLALPAARTRTAVVSGVLAIGLACLRLVPKWLGPPDFGFGLHVVALAVLLAALLWSARVDAGRIDASA